MKKTIVYVIISVVLSHLSVFPQGNNLPKKGEIHILITSPQGYSERFKDVFTQSGLLPEAIPMIETVIPEDMSDVDTLLAHIEDYEYIAFSSRKAIESFYREWSRNKVSLTGIKFCAIGKDTEYMRMKLGVEPAILPDEPSPIGIANKLAEDKDIEGKHIAVLVPRVQGIDEPNVVPDFIARLKEIGMGVTSVDAYLTKSVEPQFIDKAIELINRKEVHCIAFTSSAEIQVLLRNVKDKSILEGVTIACFGPYTAAYARKLGLKVSIVAQDFSSFKGFLEAIEQYFDKRDL
jgi:uroporphyrinogen-III synthase